jgi:hypothetical protein
MEFLAPALVMISIFGVILGVIITSHEERKLKLKIEADKAAGNVIAGEAQAEIARLKERVAVLERLATDDDRRLAGEISRLGDNAGVRG